MTLTKDEPFDYTGLHGCQSVCRLRLYEEDGRAPVALVTQLDGNVGTSVTNVVEQIATAVWKMLERPALGLTWITHYEERVRVGGRPTLKEYFVRITFEPLSDSNGIRTGFCNPCWQGISGDNVEALIGQPVTRTLQFA